MLGPGDTDEGVYLQDCVTIDDTDLAAEFTRLAADLAWWNMRLAEAERDHYVAKVAVKQAEASATLAAPERLAERGVKATVATIEATVQRMPSVQDAHVEAADRLHDLKRIKGVAEAISTKRDMLISLGAQLRREMSTGSTYDD